VNLNIIDGDNAFEGLATRTSPCRHRAFVLRYIEALSALGAFPRTIDASHVASVSFA
jgi:hypothetical protein